MKLQQGINANHTKGIHDAIKRIKTDKPTRIIINNRWPPGNTFCLRGGKSQHTHSGRLTLKGIFTKRLLYQ
ncbi:hypothetical protein MNBD_GAMMA05-108 [hydrothermal vent metagenome]|uniref:Uncharacterized protein n=1 Tax=hydrothermal vent metagenome TaxID=652676 RepID=A0A3B0WG63_9ZZZZ